MTPTRKDVYRDSGTQLALGGFIVVGIAVYSSMIIRETGEHPSAWWALLLALPIVVLMALPLRSKLVITDTIVIVVNPFGRREINKTSIVDVAAQPTGVYGLQIVLHCNDGTSIPVTALQCGWGRACRKLTALASTLKSQLIPVEPGDATNVT